MIHYRRATRPRFVTRFWTMLARVTVSGLRVCAGVFGTGSGARRSGFGELAVGHLSAGHPGPGSAKLEPRRASEMSAHHSGRFEITEIPAARSVRFRTGARLIRAPITARQG